MPEATRSNAPVLSVRTALALALGLGLAWVDTRPTWDDTGVMAFLVLIVSAAAGAAGVRPWLAAACVAGPIAVAGLSKGNVGTLLALVLAYAAASTVALIRRRA